jgi:hypothetical protein
MQSKIPFFHFFRVNKRNFSAYLSNFQCFFLNKRNFSVYLSDWLLNLIPQPISGTSPFLKFNFNIPSLEVPSNTFFDVHRLLCYSYFNETLLSLKRIKTRRGDLID